jgi:hypothetical protein
MEVDLYEYIQDNDANSLVLDYVEDLKLMDKVKKINRKILFFKYKKLYVLNSLFNDNQINFLEFAEADHAFYIQPSIIKKFNIKYKCRNFY